MSERRGPHESVPRNRNPLQAGEPARGRDHQRSRRSHHHPTVRSKGMTYHGKPHEPGYADLYRDPIAPSWAPRTHHTQRATEHVERIGWVNGKRVELTHPNTGKHGLNGVHDPRASTDGVQGQAWSASGGAHGKPSPRRGASVPSGTRTQDDGALNRTSYSGERPSPRRKA